MTNEIEEQELPGIGRRYRLAGRDGGSAVVASTTRAGATCT